MPPVPRKPQDRLAKAAPPAPDPRGRVTGKVFVWTSEDGVVIEIPLRITMRVLRSIGAGTDLDAGSMFDMLDAIMPGQSDVLDDLDVLEFQTMFSAWQSAYNAQTGASLGESSASSA